MGGTDNWFVESLLTQTLIFHVIRTNRIPFLQTWASWPLLGVTLLGYVVLTQVVKRWLFRKGWVSQ
jgi:Mg2+-importing ATPase